jgi:hypothetical protein
MKFSYFFKKLAGMDEILFNSDSIVLKYDKHQYLLELSWKKNVDSEEYKKLFNLIIKFSESNKIFYFLSDMRNQGVVRIQDVKWLELEVLRRAVEQKVKRIALVFNDIIFSTVYAETIKKKLRDSQVQVQFFSDISVARAWLTGE